MNTGHSTASSASLHSSRPSSDGGSDDFQRGDRALRIVRQRRLRVGNIHKRSAGHIRKVTGINKYNIAGTAENHECDSYPVATVISRRALVYFRTVASGSRWK